MQEVVGWGFLAQPPVAETAKFAAAIVEITLLVVKLNLSVAAVKAVSFALMELVDALLVMNFQAGLTSAPAVAEVTVSRSGDAKLPLIYEQGSPSSHL